MGISLPGIIRLPGYPRQEFPRDQNEGESCTIITGAGRAMIVTHLIRTYWLKICLFEEIIDDPVNTTRPGEEREVLLP
jgi:hypothetical protein